MQSDISPKQSSISQEDFAEEAAKTKEKFLDTVVTTIIKKQGKKHEGDLKGTQYPQVFSNIKQMLEDYDMSIIQCKKYNEAKIHRKYQIRIEDLENEIKLLKDQVDEEQRARSPSKKYVEQLIEKLVKSKQENERLNNQVIKLRSKVKEMSEGMHSPDLQESKLQKKTNLALQESDEEGKEDVLNPEYWLGETVSKFLRIRYEERKMKAQRKSHFESFLVKNKANLTSWNFYTFLTHVDVWSRQIQERIQIEQQTKLKTKAISTMSDESIISKDMTFLPRLYNSNYQIPTTLRSSNNSSHIDSLLDRKFNKNKKYHRQKKSNSTIEVMERRPKYKLM